MHSWTSPIRPFHPWQKCLASRPVLVIEEAVAQTKTHVDANAEEPSTIGAYPARFAGLQLPWEDAEEISEPGPRQQQAPSPSLKSN